MSEGGTLYIDGKPVGQAAEIAADIIGDPAVLKGPVKMPTEMTLTGTMTLTPAGYDLLLTPAYRRRRRRIHNVLCTVYAMLCRKNRKGE